MRCNLDRTQYVDSFGEIPVAYLCELFEQPGVRLVFAAINRIRVHIVSNSNEQIIHIIYLKRAYYLNAPLIYSCSKIFIFFNTGIS